MLYNILAAVMLIRVSALSNVSIGPAYHQVTEPLRHTEGPVWDHRNGLLYFLDYNRLCCYNPKRDTPACIAFDVVVSPVALVKGKTDKFIIGLNRTVFLLNWDGKSTNYTTEFLTRVSDEFPESRLNDGKADKRGRLWIGTMGKESATGVALNESALYVIDKSNLQTPQTAITPVSISNGLAWNKANNKLYYVDSFAYNIVEYAYDERTGQISNRRVVIDIKGAFGDIPSADGMTIDKDDNLWVALIRGGSVAQIDPRSGKVLKRLALPASYVTSVGWGGKHLDILFVTTSNLYLSAADKQAQPAAGSVFAITGLGTCGLPVFEADIV